MMGNFEGVSLKHVRSMDRRALKLWGQATGKTIPLRMKKICMLNVSGFKFNSMRGYRSVRLFRPTYNSILFLSKIEFTL